MQQAENSGQCAWYTASARARAANVVALARGKPREHFREISQEPRKPSVHQILPEHLLGAGSREGRSEKVVVC